MSHIIRVVVPVAEANLASFDPTPFARYLTEAGDTIPRLVERFYGVPGDEHRDLVLLIAGANGLRATATFPAGVALIIPQPGWRLLI